jgi:hypothetical protein
MNNIIFLDIDGVLKHPTQNIWYPEALACLNDYCQNNNTDIVISSTWRLIKDLEFFNALLNNRVIGKTPDLSTQYEQHTRHYECLHYIKEHNIQHYAMMDDRIEDYKDLSTVIKTNDQVGIDLSIIFKLNAILKGSIDYLITDNIDVVDRF